MRQREFESHLVLSRFFDNLVLKDRAHDVAVAYRLAMAEVRVQLPLGACKPANRTFASGGVGESGLLGDSCQRQARRCASVWKGKKLRERTFKPNLLTVAGRLQSAIDSNVPFDAVWPNGKAAPC